MLPYHRSCFLLALPADRSLQFSARAARRLPPNARLSEDVSADGVRCSGGNSGGRAAFTRCPSMELNRGLPRSAGYCDDCTGSRYDPDEAPGKEAHRSTEIPRWVQIAAFGSRVAHLASSLYGFIESIILVQISTRRTALDWLILIDQVAPGEPGCSGSCPLFWAVCLRTILRVFFAQQLITFCGLSPRFSDAKGCWRKAATGTG
jgi:hypothetical protein